MLWSWATSLTRSGRSDSRRWPPAGPRTSRQRRQAATPPHSGCIRPAPPAARRAVFTCSTTWACAPTVRARRARHRRARQVLQRGQAVLRVRLGNSMYFPFAVGATSILWPGPVTPAVVYDIIERHRPTLFFSVPMHYAMMLAHPPSAREFDLSSIRHAVSAGEALPPARSTGSGIHSASRSSTASARQRSCTSSSRTSPGACVPARAESRSPATKRASSTRTGARFPGASSAI